MFRGIPSIAATQKGRLFATWYTGGNGEEAGNYVVLVHSDDQGATWTDAEYVVVANHERLRAFDPTIFCAPDGRIFLFWAQSFSPENPPNDYVKVFDGKAGVWYSVLNNPDDSPENFIFTRPRRICDGIMMNKPVVLADGSWSLPVSVWTFPEYFSGLEGYNPGTKMYISTDNGASFRFQGEVHIPEGKRNFDEHSIYQLQDGRLAMLIRVLGGFMECTSDDNGRTWTEPVMCSIESPCSRGFIGRLPSGRLLLICNDDPAIRRNMTAAISDDDGRTWSAKVLLDGRKVCSYPDAAIMPDGSIYIIYDYNRYNGGNILLARITEEDILAARLSGENSCTGHLISSTRCK